jgi:outer membrane protein with beta-barrel domain
MTDKEFDKLLKGKLEDHQPEYDQSSWEELEDRIENEVESPTNDPFDDVVRAALDKYAFSNSNGNWEEMERRIIEDENTTFDQEVRQNVTNYEAPYDVSSWPVLDDKIAEDDRFHRRLIGAKIMEIAAILIALITFYNVFPDVKSSLFHKEQTTDLVETAVVERFASSNQHGSEIATDGQDRTNVNQISPVVVAARSVNAPPGSVERILVEDDNGPAKRSASISGIESRSTVHVVTLPYDNLVEQQLEVTYPVDGMRPSARNFMVNPLNANETVSTLEVMSLPDNLEADIEMVVPDIVPPRKDRNLRFSIGASMDVNALYMPEEQFYADGNQIMFSEKNLLATGYSAGVGLVSGKGAWSFETGLYYSSKKYDPNRILQIGKTFDVRTVDFSEINLHIVSVPIYAHWNFDKKGKTRFYAVAGGAMNLIATANYDLIVRNNFRSGPSGVTPNKNTDNEVARIRENILDGAKFSSKSYFTVAAGFGVEHYMGDRLSFFMQPMFNYQVPYFSFSDQNGKHLQYISMQLGTRVRLK